MQTSKSRRKGAQSLRRNPNWKGGKTITPSGYVLIKLPSHPAADCRGYIYEHRLIAEGIIGRRLKSNEVVHHKDGDRLNNHPLNLEIFESNAHHYLQHRTNHTLRKPGESNPIINCKCGCGGSIVKFDANGRPRKYISGHNTRDRNVKN